MSRECPTGGGGGGRGGGGMTCFKCNEEGHMSRECPQGGGGSGGRGGGFRGRGGDRGNYSYNFINIGLTNLLKVREHA